MPTLHQKLASGWNHFLQYLDLFFAGLLYPRLKSPTTDLTGKTVIITGGNAGIGLQMARKLASMNASVTLACRNMQKAEAAKEKLAPYSANIQCMQLDCSSLKSVDDFVRAWGNRPVSILINNAGAGVSHFRLNEDGYEQSYVTNMLSHAVLTLRLLPCLAEGARIIETSSMMNYNTSANTMHAKDEDFAQGLQDMGYKLGDPLPATHTLLVYSRTKLQQVFFVQALARYLQTQPQYKDKDIRVNAYHPGYVNTDIWSKEENWSDSSRKFSTTDKLTWLAGKMGVTPEQGAVTGVWLAVDPQVGSGGYYFRKAQCTPSALCTEEGRVQGFWDSWVKAAGL